MTDTERNSGDMPTVLAEVDEQGTVRLLVEGDEPFAEGPTVGRVFAGPADRDADYGYRGSPDSKACLLYTSDAADE